jgi:carbon-monoxide dehydrogenase small subunit
MHKVEIEVNGQKASAEVEARLLLVYFLRENLGLTGTHVGCDTSSCGACTVLIDGVSAKSCTIFAVQADGAQVTTIEGVGSADALHPMQEAFWSEHGLQCGYCTPGMIISAIDLLQRNPSPSDLQIREGLSGNICRCTGYENIVRAVNAAARALRNNEPRRSVRELLPAKTEKVGA